MPEHPRSVLLVTPSWSRDGGVAAHVIASATALAQHGLDVHVLAAEIDAGELAPGVRLHHGPDLFNAHASAGSRLGDALSSQPAVIHLHQFDDPAVVTLLRRHAPVVISSHGYPACTSGVHYFRPGQECTRHHGPGCVPNLLLRGCAHTRNLRSLPAAYRGASDSVAALRRADLAVSYSSCVDRHLFTNGVTRRSVVPLFATTPPRTGSGHSSRRRVVFAGRIVAAKGVGILLRAAQAVDGEFVICGDGRGLDAMRRLARRLGVQRRVHFRGWLAAGEIAQELAEASVVAVPSVWPEPFGLVGVEALAAGRPVVASFTGGIGDWLEDGVSALGVPAGDVPALAGALNELLADPARQQAMGAAGIAMVAARFSAEHHVSALLGAYSAARASWQSDRRGDLTAATAPAAATRASRAR